MWSENTNENEQNIANDPVIITHLNNPTPRKRGRPLGSKNKPKAQAAIKTLIIYEESPEVVHLFLIDMTDEDFAKYSKIAGMYLNQGEMSEEEEVIANDLQVKLFNHERDNEPHIWIGNKIGALTSDICVGRIIVTGFVL